ncbi:hypothetical protein ACLKA6_010442 [Drosophila palustris]
MPASESITTANGGDNDDGDSDVVMIDASPHSTHLDRLVDQLNRIIGTNDFVIKLGSRGIARINSRTIDAYRSIIKVLESDKSIQFNTYQPRAERSFRVVVLGLHASTPTERIRNELTQMGFNVTNIHNPIFKNKNGHGTYVPDLFFIDLQPGHMLNRQIFEVKRLCQHLATNRNPSMPIDPHRRWAQTQLLLQQQHQRQQQLAPAAKSSDDWRDPFIQQLILRLSEDKSNTVLSTPFLFQSATGRVKSRAAKRL